MSYYWVTTKEGSGTVKASTEIELKETVQDLGKGEILSFDTLPYPAGPAWNHCGMPHFCYSPETCKGRSACPRPYSCTD